MKRIAVLIIFLWITLALSGYVQKSGDCTGETWYTGQTYYVVGDVIIQGDGSLNIEPGATIKFAPQTSLIVYGTIDAGQMNADDVVFTSKNDNTIGDILPDSNGEPAYGDWRCLLLDGDSYGTPAAATLLTCIFRYGGDSTGFDYHAMLVFNGAGFGVSDASSCTFSYSDGAAVYGYNANDRFRYCTFENNRGSAVYAEGVATTGENFDLGQDASGEHGGNYFTNNDFLGDGTIIQNVWTKPVDAYFNNWGNYTTVTQIAAHMSGPINFGGIQYSGQIPDNNWPLAGSPYIITSNAQIGDGSMLNIASSTDVRFAPDARLTVVGDLVSDGVTYTTDGAGTWEGILIGPSSLSTQITNCVIRNARRGLELNNPSVQLDNLTLEFTEMPIQGEVAIDVTSGTDFQFNNLTIVGYPQGLNIVNNTREVITPTLSSLTLVASELYWGEQTGLTMDGAIEATLSDLEFTGYTNGIRYIGTGTEGGSGRRTLPTISNVRIRTRSDTHWYQLGMSIQDIKDWSITTDSLVIEGYPTGMQYFYSPVNRIAASPTISNLRIRSSSDATRNSTGIVINGSVEATLTDIVIQDCDNGIQYYGTGTEGGSGRAVPTLGNIRIRTSSDATRLPIKGMMFYNIQNLVTGPDSIFIEGYPTGVEILYDYAGRLDATPTLANLRIRSSSDATRNSKGIYLMGAIDADITNSIITGSDYGVYYDYNGQTRSTPVLSNLRVRTSSDATRTGITGIYLDDLAQPTVDNCDIIDFSTGISAISYNRDRSTPVLANNRIRLSTDATRNTGIGIDLGMGVTATVSGNEIWDGAIGIQGIGCNHSTIYENMLRNNDTGIRLGTTQADQTVHHNMIWLSPDYSSTQIAGIQLNGLYGPGMFYNNTIYGYTTGLNAAVASSVTFLNNIIWGPQPSNSAINDDSSVVDATYNLITQVDGSYDGTGNLNVNPQFVNAPAGDFNLLPTSPCINAGTPDPAYNDPDGTRSDIGALYYDVSGAPAPLQPSDGVPDIANVAADYPGLFWRAGDYNASWVCELDDYPDFATPLLTSGMLSEPEYFFGTGFTLTPGAQYHARVTPYNIAGVTGPALSWSFTVYDPTSPDTAGTGTAGGQVDPGAWSGGDGFEDFFLPQTGDVPLPVFSFNPTTDPTSSIVFLVEMGIAFGGTNPDDFNAFLSDMPPMGASGDFELGFHVYCSDSGALGGSYVIDLTGYPAVINFLYYSVDGGPWQAVPAWNFTGGVLTIPGFDPGRAGGTVDFGAGTDDFTLPVTLSSFNAVTTTSGSVMLDWTAQSESDLLGYHVLRDPEGDLHQALRLTAVPLQAQNLPQAVTYTFEDVETEVGDTFHYWLEVLEFDGTSGIAGPVMITVGEEPGEGDAPPVVYADQLLPNYPNPFNPDTTIKYSVAGDNGEDAHVQIDILNLRGQLVRVLYNGLHQPTPEATIVWNGRDSEGRPMPSGIYFLRMQTPEKRFIRKIMMLK